MMYILAENLRFSCALKTTLYKNLCAFAFFPTLIKSNSRCYINWIIKNLYP